MLKFLLEALFNNILFCTVADIDDDIGKFSLIISISLSCCCFPVKVGALADSPKLDDAAFAWVPIIWISLLVAFRVFCWVDAYFAVVFLSLFTNYVFNGKPKVSGNSATDDDSYEVVAEVVDGFDVVLL